MTRGGAEAFDQARSFERGNMPLFKRLPRWPEAGVLRNIGPLHICFFLIFILFF